MDRPGTAPFVAALAQTAIECGAPAPLRQMLEIRLTDTCRKFGDGGRYELLKALRELINVYDNGTVIDLENEFEKARAAIAKATGGE